MEHNSSFSFTFQEILTVRHTGQPQALDSLPNRNPDPLLHCPLQSLMAANLYKSKNKKKYKGESFTFERLAPPAFVCNLRELTPCATTHHRHPQVMAQVRRAYALMGRWVHRRKAEMDAAKANSSPLSLPSETSPLGSTILSGLGLAEAAPSPSSPESPESRGKPRMQRRASTRPVDSALIADEEMADFMMLESG